MNATTIRRPRALLLDDDPTVLRLLATALEARGFDVRAATDAQTGIEILTDELLDLDVLVADAELPGRDAASLVHLVRRAGGERDALAELNAHIVDNVDALLYEGNTNSLIENATGGRGHDIIIGTFAEQEIDNLVAKIREVKTAATTPIILVLRDKPDRHIRLITAPVQEHKPLMFGLSPLIREIETELLK